MATNTAQWGSRIFQVDPSRVVPLLSLSTGYARKSETNNDTSGQPTTNTRGLELQQFTLSTRYVAAVGLDPRAEIEAWRGEFENRYPLILNGSQFGPDLLELVSVDVSEVLLDNQGRMLSADVSITLEEYIPPETTVTDKKEPTGGSTGDSSGGTKSQAMSAGPKAAEKETMKPTPARSSEAVPLTS